MEKNKQLTDEEIIRALEYCAGEYGCGKDCPLCEISDCTWFISKHALDLIHRLQAENERLKTEFKSDYKNSWRNKFFTALEENTKLQQQVNELKMAYKDLVESCRNCTAIKDTNVEVE